jgi:uncharacterized RDD family membrane protein YckC
MDVHARVPLERQIVIRTPENLELTYELAGAGTRSAAYFVDILLLYLLLSLLQNLVVGTMTVISDDWIGYALAAWGLLAFAITTGYFMIFELIWSGQTPGKRAVGIRVVKTGGYALRFGDSLVRNLMRAIDFLPVFYGVGLLSLLLTRHSQRLGDLVAGTLVVYQQSAASAHEPPAMPNIDRTPLSLVQLGAIPRDVLEACDEFLRMMNDLSPRYRQELAESLVVLIEKTSGLSPAVTQSSEAFLAGVIHQSGQTPQET